MLVKYVYFLSAFSLLVSSFGCGGKDEGFKQKFNAGLSIGDLVEIDLDTKARTYSYEIAEGDYKGKKGSGKLTQQPLFGKNAFKTDEGHFVLAIENKFVLGVIGNDFYVGVPQKDQKIELSDIAGDYNFVSYFPNGVKKTLQGSVEIQADGTGKVVLDANLPDATAANTIAMKVVRRTNCTFTIESTDGKTKYANFLPRLDNGNVFAVVDFADKNSLKGIGFAEKQKHLPENSLDGSYVAYETGADDFFSKGVVKGNDLTVTNSSFPNSAHVKISLNTPWNGVVHGQHQFFDFYGLYSGSELYSIIIDKRLPTPQAFIAVKE